MKPGKILASQFLFLLTALLLLNSCSEEQSNSPETSFSSQESIFLYGKNAITVNGNLPLQPGDNMTWEGDAGLVWEVDIQNDDTYELFLIGNVRAKGDSTTISFKTSKKTQNFTLSTTLGPYGKGRNFQRIKLSSSVRLEQGKQQLSLATSGISTEGILLDFRALELLPISKKKQIIEEEQRAINSRESVDWMLETGYGLMFHWTSQSVQPGGSIKNYEDAVNEFDVLKFANMVEETGAGYVMFTIGHAESYCPAPIKSWEKVHPGKTTKRDLIKEIADALNKRDIRLICYINGPLAFKFYKEKVLTEADKQDFVSNFKDILSEMGNRYQYQIAGYWFDSWYQIFEAYPEVPFEEFNKAAKTGNQDRIICLNSWIYPAVTPWQDYWAGEVGGPIDVPQNGFMKNGPVPNLPYQALLIMEPYWVQKKGESPDPRFTPEKLSTYIKQCKENGGAVTINLGIFQDGTVGEKALQVMREVKREIRE